MHQWQIHIQTDIGQMLNLRFRATKYKKPVHQIQNPKLHQCFEQFYCQFHKKIALVELALLKSLSMQTILKWTYSWMLNIGCRPVWHSNVFNVHVSILKMNDPTVSIKTKFYLPLTSDRAPFAGNCIVSIVTSVVNNAISMLTYIFSLSNDFVYLQNE